MMRQEVFRKMSLMGSCSDDRLATRGVTLTEAGVVASQGFPKPLGARD